MCITNRQEEEEEVAHGPISALPLPLEIFIHHQHFRTTLPTLFEHLLLIDCVFGLSFVVFVLLILAGSDDDTVDF
jgi:hypothetical protein